MVEANAQDAFIFSTFFLFCCDVSFYWQALCDIHLANGAYMCVAINGDHAIFLEIC